MSFNDKSIIETNNELNDNHINFAQGLLKSQFSSIEGLCCTLYQSRFKIDCMKPLVQIIHSRGDHWIVISSGMGEVSIYDSVYSDIDFQLISSMTKATEISLARGLHEKQVGSTDCGVVAIA